MKHDDLEFENRLRKVHVPQDLKDRLRQIPIKFDSHEHDQADRGEAMKHLPRVTDRGKWQPSFSKARNIVSAAIVIAASMAGFSFYLLWNLPVKNPLIVNQNPSSKLDTEISLPLLTDLQLNIECLNQVLDRRKLLQLEQRLEKVELSNRRSNYSHVPPNESTAYILALTSQSAIRMGVDHAIAQRDLEFVIDKYPNTRGAELAAEIMQNEL